MATKVIPWTDGTGNITLSYTGQGNDSVTVASDPNNLYHERSQTLTFKTTDNAISRQVTVTQTMKEPNLIDSEGKWLIDANDTYLIV